MIPLAADSRRGFTLIELLVVIAIIGLLSSVVMASLNTARVKARNAAYVSQMRQYMTAFELYYSEYGQYPVSGGYWACIGTGRPGGSPCWSTAYSESSSLSTGFRTAIAPYISGTAIPGVDHAPYTPLYYSAGPSYYAIMVLEGDGDCPIGVKDTGSTGYASAGVIRCNIIYP